MNSDFPSTCELARGPETDSSCIVETGVSTNTARILISRKAARDIQIRGIEILIDEKFVANLAYGETFETTLEPGHHRLTATNRMYSPTIEFDVAAGEEIRFTTSSIALGGLWLLVAMMGTVPYKVTLERAS